METEQQGSPSRWNSRQAYSFAGICLLAGIASGYLIHGPSKPVIIPSDSSRQVQQRQPGEISPRAMPDVSKMRPTVDQMKHMADKKAELLLIKLKSNPADPALLAEIGKVYLRAHQFDTAIDYFEKSVKLKADPKVLTTLGGTYHFTGADDNALDAWNRALKVDPNNADALVNIGLVKLQSKSDPQAAIAAWTQMLKTNPNHPQRAAVEKMIAGAKKQIVSNQ